MVLNNELYGGTALTPFIVHSRPLTAASIPRPAMLHHVLLRCCCCRSLSTATRPWAAMRAMKATRRATRTRVGSAMRRRVVPCDAC